MPSSVSAHPTRSEQRPIAAPVAGLAFPQLRPLSSIRDGLTQIDTIALHGIALALEGAWRCLIRHDGHGRQWAVIRAEEPSLTRPSAFLICCSDGRLQLINIISAIHWQTVGSYDDAADLGAALGDIVMPRQKGTVTGA